MLSFLFKKKTFSLSTLIIDGHLPTSESYGNWLLPSLSSSETPQLIILYEQYLMYTLNISSLVDWKIIGYKIRFFI